MSQYGQTAGGAAYGAFQEAGVPYGYSAPFAEQFSGNHAEKAPFRPGMRRRLNGTAVCISVLAPWLLFTVVLGLLSFPVHYNNPGAVYLAVVLCFAAVAWVAFYAYIHRTTRSHSPEHEPSWLFFLTLSLALAWMLGIAMGYLNYITNTLPYQQMTHLNSYSDVDPGLMRGAQLMDAGSVMFAEGSMLDLNKSMGFKNQEVYCVAPIVKGSGERATYDFWAIGIDCCSGRKNDFHCDGAKNPRVHGALRLIPSAARPFYRLPVQQAEATHKIRANHPLFFSWVEDPQDRIDAWKDAATNSFLTSMFSYMVFQAFLVAVATLAFSRMGKS
mmetsp:Transcript_96761/g.255549  ORF Transcript_96761/g.255549 Transcript_96761/m.255549 type:complete len:329 (+) Transcript_96761:103-1089(+)